MVKLPLLLILASILLALTIEPLHGQAGEKPRIFVTDSDSWEMSGGFADVEEGGGGGFAGGARPQTAEIIKTFGERCPESVVTVKKENADFS